MADLVINQRSIAYPVRIDSGSIQTVDAPEYLGQQIRMFCQTVQGERPLIPEWGLPVIVHQKEISRQEILAVVLANLNRFFPVRITGEVRGEYIQGLVEINLTYETPSGYETVTVEI